MLISDPQAKVGGQRRGWVGLVLAFEGFTPSDTPPTRLTHLLILPNQATSQEPNIELYEPTETGLIQTSTGQRVTLDVVGTSSQSRWSECRREMRRRTMQPLLSLTASSPP